MEIEVKCKSESLTTVTVPDFWRLLVTPYYLCFYCSVFVIELFLKMEYILYFKSWMYYIIKSYSQNAKKKLQLLFLCGIEPL